MRARIVYWKDLDKLELAESTEDVKPTVFKSADYAYWKVLVADQEVVVRRGQVAFVKIKDIHLPPNTVVSPLSIMRHALGVVVDVYEEKPSKVEMEKKIVAAAFLPISDGVIEKGDLIGVVKVYAVSVAPPDKVGKIKAPQVTLELESHKANLVYASNGRIVRERAEMSEYWYRRWHIAEWYPLIADESIDVSAGRVEVIRIKTVEIPENTIPVPLSMMRHALGSVLDVCHLGKPKKVEERKIVTNAIFVPAFDGKIEKGDLIGVLNVYYISTGERVTSLMRYLTQSEEANIKYWSQGKITKKMIRIDPFSFKRSSIGWFEPLIAAESKNVKANKVELIEIEELEFPSGTIVQPLTARNHALGSVIDVASFEAPKRVEEDKSVTHALMLTHRDGRIEEGDLLGTLTVYHVSVLREPEFFIAKYRELFAR